MRLSLKDDVNSLSFFKANFNRVLHQARANHRPQIITQNGRSSGVFMDIETWETQQKKLLLFKLVNEGEVSLKNEKTFSPEETENFFAKKYGI
jgi:prevent-host-death family protein